MANQARYVNLIDAQVWLLFKEGDEEALVYLYQRFYRDLYSYGVKVSGSQEATKDGIQDLFTELWLRRQRVREVQRIKPYLLKYLRRKLRKKMVQQAQFSDIDQLAEEGFELVLSYEQFLVEEQTRDELTRKLATVVQQLTGRQREIIYLKFYEGLDYETIAQVMGLQYQSVRNLLHEALKVLKKHFSLLGWAIILSAVL
ncbi:MAG: sigma-70 family RNA polymerase sigma factor [Ferruginibacter sp.]|nr:sigma-70 family RNA polymerase sigma factor [Cytophagales bacterium]